MKNLFIVALFLPLLKCPAQLIRSPVSETHLGMAAFSDKVIEAFSFCNNQAALARIKNPVAAVYIENRFMLEDLKLLAAVFVLPLEKASAGLSISHGGFKEYNEKQVGLAYGRLLDEKLSLGIQIDYHLHQISGYGNYSAIGTQLGMIFRITEKLQTGIHANNAVGGKFTKLTGEKMASVYTFGWGYDVSDKLYLNAQLSKEETKPLSVHVAIHYAFDEHFFVRCGVASGSDRSFATLGLNRRRFIMQLSASWNPHLGLSPSLMLAFPLNKPP